MGTRLYIGNLPPDSTEESIRAVFASHGREVQEVHLVADRTTGKPRGFAFVVIADGAQARAAIEEMDGLTFEGRQLSVNEARERDLGGGGRRR